MVQAFHYYPILQIAKNFTFVTQRNHLNFEVQCPDGQHFDKTIIETLNKCVPPEQSLCRNYGNGDFKFNGYFDEDGEYNFKHEIPLVLVLIRLCSWFLPIFVTLLQILVQFY